MISKHPFSILLLLLLAAGVFAASLSADDWRTGFLLQDCEVEASLEEHMEEALEEEIDFCFDVIAPTVFHILSEIHFNRPADQPCGGNRHTSALCSIGWMLPLRI